jgi:hypothetical protein
MSGINDDAEFDLDFDLDEESELLDQPRKRMRVEPKQPKQTKQTKKTKQTKPNTRPAPTTEQLATGLVFGTYGNGLFYDAKNARDGPTDPAAAKLSDQVFRIGDLTKRDRAEMEANAKIAGDYVEGAPIGTFDSEAFENAAYVIKQRKMQEEQELKDAANDAATAIDENEMQEDYHNLNDAIAAIEERENQQTKKQRRGGKGRKTNTKTKSKKSKKSKKQRKNKSRKSSRRNHKK